MAVKKKSETISTLPFNAISVLLELSSSMLVVFCLTTKGQRQKNDLVLWANDRRPTADAGHSWNLVMLLGLVFVRKKPMSTTMMQAAIRSATRRAIASRNFSALVAVDDEFPG